MTILGPIILFALSGALAWQLRRPQPPLSREQGRDAAALRIVEEQYARHRIGREELLEQRRRLLSSQ